MLLKVSHDLSVDLHIEDGSEAEADILQVKWRCGGVAVWRCGGVAVK